VANILIVDDEPGLREFMIDTLDGDGHELYEAADGATAIQRLRERAYDLLITDLRMPGSIDGIDVLREVRAAYPETRVIVLTAHGSVATAVDAMRLGAHDFLEKPVSGPTELRIVVSRALDAHYDAETNDGSSGGTATERIARQLGRALGPDYSVERLIGKGGYAAVFEVFDRRLRRRLAAKVLLPEFATADHADRFRREVRTIARLSHPNIVPVYFVGRERDIPCFVMPLVSNISAATLITTHGSLGIPVVLRMAREIAGALDFAHRMGVVHRDVKPENILIDATTGRTMLADFGIAKAFVPTGVSTGPGVFIGTPRYASPEQIVGEANVDQRSDVYSFGVVIYEMLSGRVPFDGPNANSIITQHLVAPVPPLNAHLPHVSSKMDAVIARALAKDPVDRYATVGAFVLALDIAARMNAA
jgi:CheY-like chemotaxis protein/tRNA A-37 threonylcarbamoyl transferase component Bud32